MSKLFDTLEQIRRNESYQVSGEARIKQAKTSGKKGIFKIFLVTMILASGCAVLLLYIPRFAAQKDNIAVESYPAVVTPAVTIQGRSVLLASKENKDIVRINNDAVRFIINHDHWRGVYMLATILDRDPDNIETNINLGVALMELGFVEAAKQYLQRAIRLDRNNQALKKNIHLLINAGIIDESFLEPG